MTRIGAVSLEPAVLKIEGDELTLLGSRCKDCARYFFPQRTYCGACATATTETVDLSREGTLTSFTRLYRKPGFSLIEAPYLMAEVTLPEGLRIYSVLIGEPDSDPEIGDEVLLQGVLVQTTKEGAGVMAYAFCVKGTNAGA